MSRKEVLVALVVLTLSLPFFMLFMIWEGWRMLVCDYKEWYER